MLHFNGLNYYAMPGLPLGWKAPTWLMIELGIFAGRLYFEYEEYDDLRRYIGLRDTATMLTETPDNAVAPASLDGVHGQIDDASENMEIDARAGEVQSFTTKPLTFLREWLAIRRKGQDFLHTPMGCVCQGKSLTQNHPFFKKVTDDGATKTEAADVSTGQRKEGITGACSSNGDFASNEEVCDDDYYYDDDDEEDKNRMSDETELMEADTGDFKGAMCDTIEHEE